MMICKAHFFKFQMISNWFGLNNGKLIGEPPAYVDKQKIPGMSPIPKPTVLGWIQHAPFVLITSPNFVWANISLLIYFFNSAYISLIDANLDSSSFKLFLDCSKSL